MDLKYFIYIIVIAVVVGATVGIVAAVRSRKPAPAVIGSIPAPEGTTTGISFARFRGNAQILFRYPAVWGDFVYSLNTPIPDVGYTFAERSEFLVLSYPRLAGTFDPSIYGPDRQPSASVSFTRSSGSCQFFIARKSDPVSRCAVLALPGAEVAYGVIPKGAGIPFAGALATIIPANHPSLARVDILQYGSNTIEQLAGMVSQLSFSTP